MADNDKSRVTKDSSKSSCGSPVGIPDTLILPNPGGPGSPEPLASVVPTPAFMSFNFQVMINEDSASELVSLLSQAVMAYSSEVNQTQLSAAVRWLNEVYGDAEE